MEGHEDTQETQTGHEFRVDGHELGITLTAGLIRAGAHLLNDPAFEQSSLHLPPKQIAQEQSSPTHEGSISMFCGLMVCELSVDDEGQQSEQDDGDRNWHDNWNNWDENLGSERDGHKIEKMGSQRDDERDDGRSQN